MHHIVLLVFVACGALALIVVATLSLRHSTAKRTRRLRAVRYRLRPIDLDPPD